MACRIHLADLEPLDRKIQERTQPARELGKVRSGPEDEHATKKNEKPGGRVPPILVKQEAGKPLVIYLDAAEKAVPGALVQEKEKVQEPVYFFKQNPLRSGVDIPKDWKSRPSPSPWSPEGHDSIFNTLPTHLRNKSYDSARNHRRKHPSICL
ncbi:hypothetical protein PIB30_023220 [Stylosanthes scabra]|uniref:Uncharacterized protein n=1 Tax=Stylosanthes scabra TaxID=79078 RepID=A0ABU6W926_9FABA|nr:hypothetical protein [Stylosanthes scabra]